VITAVSLVVCLIESSLLPDIRAILFAGLVVLG
jgi:hypothetical protein